MDRRSLLAGAGTATASLLAGCAALPGLGGGDGNDAEWDRVAGWLAFGTHPHETTSDYSVRGRRVARILDRQSDLPDEAVATTLEDVTPRESGLEPEAVDVDLDVFATGDPMPSLYSVTLGEFSREDVVASLTESGLRQTRTDGDYAVLRRETGEEAWLLVDDGAVVWVPYATGTRGAPEVVLETARGERENVLDAVEPLSDVIDRLPRGISFQLGTDDPEGEPPVNEPQFPGLDAAGSSTVVTDDETLRTTACYHFLDGERASAADVASEYEFVESDPAWDALEVERDGPFVEVTFEQGSGS